MNRRTSDVPWVPADPDDPDREEAFEEAGKGLKPRQRERGYDGGMDRKIYAVDGVRRLPGGLPTLGKKRR